ncbi:hypothetical protein H0H87_012188 [Tephrocybe sp. NHM501043]|nr:hypothetical protein H0H87_012188 [Tephrocybe sp. NHM501043]
MGLKDVSDQEGPFIDIHLASSDDIASADPPPGTANMLGREDCGHQDISGDISSSSLDSERDAKLTSPPHAAHALAPPVPSVGTFPTQANPSYFHTHPSHSVCYPLLSYQKGRKLPSGIPVPFQEADHSFSQPGVVPPAVTPHPSLSMVFPSLRTPLPLALPEGLELAQITAALSSLNPLDSSSNPLMLTRADLNALISAMIAQAG